MSQFSLSWNSFKSNICNGLSSLQQKEEFVDMTLAADGHFVKVHQMIISLASPYLKELIKSAPCSHPVIFLNKISYPILCCILEYVYSGEVLVHKDNLQELIEAGKALHIKGLEDVCPNQGIAKPDEQSNIQVKVTQSNSTLVDNLYNFKTRTRKSSSRDKHVVTVREGSSSRDHHMEDDNISDPFTDLTGDTFHDDDPIDDAEDSPSEAKRKKADIVDFAVSRSVKSSTVPDSTEAGSKTVQYTLSNQGSLQLVLNRFVYFLRYAHKNSNPPIRQWRCVDYIRNRCPASVTTKDDIVVQRVAAHKHPFHDKKIVKKMQAGAIFTAIKDAEKQGKQLCWKKQDADKGLSDKE